MPIAELAGGMQVLHIAAEERKPNEYAAVPGVQRLKGEARRDRREEGCCAGCTDIFIPTMTSKERVGRRWSRPHDHYSEQWFALGSDGTHASWIERGKEEEDLLVEILSFTLHMRALAFA
jgi:hypothetical protein